MRITEQWILSHAPSPIVAESGREVAEAGSLGARGRTEDGNTYWAECAGSAQNPYYASVDWALSEEEPVYSCSCPSRHVPCKHVMGLMFDILAGEEYPVAKTPAYVLKVRRNRIADNARAATRLERRRQFDASAKGKRLDRQMEGLAKAEKMSNELLANGLGSLSELPAQALGRMARELAGYDLTGPRDAFERIALLGRELRRDEPNARRYYAEMLRELSALRAMTAASREFLREQRASASYALEDPILYQALGGVWNADELRELGSCRRNARLVQLSFDVSYDEAKRGYTERGFWLELTRGDIVRTRNFRAARQEKYSARDDSCFTLREVPILYDAPDAPVPSVWWDYAADQEMTGDDWDMIRRAADTRLDDAVNKAKTQLKQPLLPGYVPVLVTVGEVGYAGDRLLLADGEGTRIMLCDRPEDGASHASARRLAELATPPAAGDLIFGLMYHDEACGRICLHPYSLVTADDIIRLQF